MLTLPATINGAVMGVLIIATAAFVYAAWCLWPDPGDREVTRGLREHRAAMRALRRAGRETRP
jgi:hypothetical protein